MDTSITSRFEYAAKIVLYVIAAALPLWFIPWPVGVEFGREITFGILILLGAVAWLLSVLTRGEIRWRHSIILYSTAGLLVIFGAATILSKAPWVSAFLADPIAERFLTLIFGAALMVLTSHVFRSREEAGTAALILVFAGALAGLLSFMQIFGFSPYQLAGGNLQFIRGNDFNVVGTLNGLALFYAALFITSVGLLFAFGKSILKPWVRYALIASPAIFFLNIFLINFRTAWIVLLGSAIVLFGLSVVNPVKGGASSVASRLRFDWRTWLTLGLLVVSIVMLLVPGSAFNFTNIPAEVSPSLGASWRIASAVFEEGAKTSLLGSGPGMFGLDWVKYKDPSINQTFFWNVRFNQGSSWFMTILATTGLLGALAFLAFLGISLFVFLRSFLIYPVRGEASIGVGVLLGFVALVLSSFLYPVNLTFLLLLFFLAGIAIFILSSGEQGLWEIEERSVRLEAPWAVFLSSLVIIFLISLSVAGMYTEINRFRTALFRAQGVGALNRGDVDKALESFSRMTALENKNPRNYQVLVQTQTQKIQQIIQQAVRGVNVQQEFQSAVSRAVDTSRTGVSLNPWEPSLWRTQAGLYELVIPFIQGSESFSFSSYQRASELDPINPAIYVEWGRAQMTFTDRVGLAASQARGEERRGLEQAQAEILGSAERAFGRAIEVKSDYAPAHFLLAQAAIRRGSIAEAIRNTENARQAAPFDIGIAFQLGLLYYQNDNLARARQEFERALTINSNYSNARYFLGLIYSRQGERNSAIQEFERIREFNPDNDEVKRILANLRAGRTALDGIVPPAEPPEERKETPVK